MDNTGRASLAIRAVYPGISGSLALAAEPLTKFGNVAFEEMRSGPGATGAVDCSTKVLLVDDDDDLRQVMEWTLEAEGYAVVSCMDPQRASEAFRSHADIGFLLTDLQMPGKSGAQLARELTALHPSLPVMIVSGSTISAELTREIRDRRWTFLRKPFDVPALLENVHLLMRMRHQQAA